MKIGSVQNHVIAELLQKQTAGDSPKKADDFGSLLMDAMKQVSGAQADSLALQEDFMAGRQVEFHELMIAMERAGIAMDLTLQVRNKLLEAYQEISRMQV